MSELSQNNEIGSVIRKRLMDGVSALALVACIAPLATARADDADRPQVWLELGGQLSRLEDKQEIYSPPFLAMEPSQFTSPLGALKPPANSIAASGSISIQPNGSNWIFSASIRYGRANNKNHFHQQTYPSSHIKYGPANITYIRPFAAQFIDAKGSNTENHAVLDFQVGRDLGIGLFGHDSSSTLNFGIRFAQFQSKSSASLHEDPDWYFQVKNYTIGVVHFQAIHQPYHSYAGEFEAARNFRGVGPALSWKSSAPFLGNAHGGTLAFDWGINASLLFGRQKTQTQHHETGRYHPPGVGPLGGNYAGPLTTLYHHPTDAPAYHSTRSRSVTVPNIGGFAGVSFKYPSAKISVGYRADFFFGAVDGGIGTRENEDRNFYGPFATISIGLGG